MKTMRDWVFSIPTAVAFGLTLGFYEIVGRIALLFGLRPFEWAMAGLQRTLLWVFKISNVHVEVERDPGLLRDGAYLFVSNHQSMFDVPIFGGLLVRSFPKYVAKKELGRWIPSVSLNLKRGGNALIDRDDRRQAVAAIEELGRTAQRRGTSVVIFPEGSRSRDGELKPFKSAGLAMLMRAAPQMPIVPTVIDGSWRVFEHNLFPIPFGARVKIRFGTPIARTEAEKPDEVLREVEESIRATLATWRA